VLLATWNVNGVRARAQRLTEFLTERKPDIVCLQELKSTDSDFPHLELRALGYHPVLVGQPSWNGVAVLAKTQPELVLGELPGAAEHGARFVLARVYGIEIASVYVPNGKTVEHNDYRMKLGWLERLATLVESRADRDAPLVLGGDFNVCPTDLDSYGGAALRGHIFHTDEERALMNRLFRAGLIDLFRARHPSDSGFSWWDYRGGAFHKKQGLRIDLLLATPAVARRVTEIVVDRDYRKKGDSGSTPSDHAPVVATLQD
jgi:exodeoxyribonuclease-3